MMCSAQIFAAAFQKIDQSTRGGNKDIRAFGQDIELAFSKTPRQQRNLREVLSFL